MRRWLAPFALCLCLAAYGVYTAPSSAVPLAQEPTPTANFVAERYEVRAPYTTLTVAPGELATYLLTIRNLDTLPETYNIEISTIGGTFSYSIEDPLDPTRPISNLISIAAGQERTTAIRASGSGANTEQTVRIFINARGRRGSAGVSLTTRIGPAVPTATPVGSPTPTGTPAAPPLFATNTPQAANYLPHVSR